MTVLETRSGRLLALLLAAGFIVASGDIAMAGRGNAAVRRIARPRLRPVAPHRPARALGRGFALPFRVTPVEPVRVARYRAGLPREVLQERAAPGTWGRQRQSQWCWAASSQMILNYLGLAISQEAVITRAYGGFLDRPATPEEISTTLNGWTVADPSGRLATVAARAYDGMPIDIVIRDLNASRPLIVGLRNPSGQGGHAYVMTAVSYDVDQHGRPTAVSALLRDPWPTNPSLVEVPWAELNQRFLGAVRIDVGRPGR